MQRLKDEAALRVCLYNNYTIRFIQTLYCCIVLVQILKWNFSTPTDEHLEQLSTMISQYAVSSLQGMLFSKDFKMHIKACEEIVKVNYVTLLQSLELRWLTLIQKLS